ncbi:endoglucanase [Rhodoferax ferrireducens]|uniref:Endoglucanase n=1 Tax=Rhodoferax ferrireducens TaxID=192843 RepID=A0ABU2C6F1_9BURK|nr:glycoside hydrolase family 5 protein [Rhodoferax ferrireducens]MDR7376890.1 endoglucanase [Rhodoferax ferrireducens]
MNIHKFLALFLIFTFGFAGAQISAANNGPLTGKQSCHAVSTETCEIANALGRGINMGNMLEAPREGDWGIRLDPAFIPIATEKFKTLRIPVRWTNHAAATVDATIDEFFAKRVDKAIDQALGADAYVIVNQHHYSQLFGDKLQPNEFAVDPSVIEQRFINIWQQLANRYKDRSPRLVFELLNEPHGTLTAEAWNMLASKALAVIRQVDRKRTVMIGPTYWNHPKDLEKLKLPDDKNIIVAIHTYDPFNFTHQGISYMPQFPKGARCCDEKQIRMMEASIETAVKWSKTNGYPLHLGEFGSHQAAAMESREDYTRIMRNISEKNGIGWTYWEFGWLFGVYDPSKSAWIEPIRRALLD